MSGITSGSDARARFRGIRLLVLAGALVAATATVAQDAPPATAPPATAPPVNQPGFLDAVGRWLGDSKDKLGEQFKSTGDAAKSAAEAAGQATGVIMGLPGTRVIKGRMRCPLAPNGAPDCAQGAEALCRANGFNAGRHVEISTAQSCKPRLTMGDKPHLERNCKTDTYVIRAACQ